MRSLWTNFSEVPFKIQQQWSFGYSGAPVILAYRTAVGPFVAKAQGSRVHIVNYGFRDIIVIQPPRYYEVRSVINCQSILSPLYAPFVSGIQAYEISALAPDIARISKTSTWIQITLI